MWYYKNWLDSVFLPRGENIAFYSGVTGITGRLAVLGVEMRIIFGRMRMTILVGVVQYGDSYLH